MEKETILKNFLKDFEFYNEYEPVDIYKIIKNNWIKIIKNHFWKNEIFWTRGIPFWIDIIYVKNNLSEKEERFILAHEFCHFLLNEKSFNMWILKVKSEEEIRADNFACDLLLPDEAVKNAYLKYENIPTLSDIFWVPESVVEYKLNKLFKNYNFY